MVKNVGKNIQTISIFAVAFCTAAALPTAEAAFSSNFAGSTLTLTQTVDDGNIVIDNNGAGGAFRAIDGSGTTEFVTATNLVINLLDNTGNVLDLDLDAAVAGGVTINLGEGTRSLNFIGSVNSVGGLLAITGGSGDQTVEVAVNANLTVGGDMSASLGAGIDTVDEDGNDVAITGGLTLVGVNEFENNGTMTVGANVSVDSSSETETTRFDDDSELAITGNFTFIGGDGRDEILLNDAGVTTVGGFVDIDLGDNTVGGTQFAWFNSADTTITGYVSVVSSNSSTPDDFQDIAGATFSDNVIIDLGGGENDADFLGNYAGTVGTYQGGSGVDTVIIDATAASMDFGVSLAESSDTFTLGAATSLSSLSVDLGCESNTLVDNLGPNYPFTVWIFECEGTFTVNKTFSDSNPTSVNLAIACSDAFSIDNSGGVSGADKDNPAVFSVGWFSADSPSCTAEEIDGIPGYTTTNCTVAVDLVDGGNVSCTVVNTQNPVLITVEKEYTDGSQGPVTVDMVCSSGGLDAPSKPASPGNPAQFTLSNFLFTGATCTATESDVPGGYYLAATTCGGMNLQVGGGARCVLTNAPTRTTFEVQKVFSDDSQASVEVQIDCDNALIPDHIKTLDADNNWHHTWVMIEFDSSDMNCTVSETRPAGYLEYYDADLLNQGELLTWGEWYDDTDNPPEPDLGCRYENIVGGEEYYCEIYNELQAVEVDVTKQWFDDHREFKNPLWAKAHWECVNARAEQFDGEIDHYVHPYTDTDEGYLEYSEYGYDASLKQTESFWVLPNWDTSVGNQTVCTIYEKIRDSSVMSDNSDCEAVAVYPSDNVDFSCTITNTRIYEGVPTLSQYGLALLALLMLGVGLIGFRRFA